MEERTLKRELALSCRILAANGHGDNVFGHVTARLEGWDRFWMKPAAMGLEEVTADDLILVDLEGHVLAGSRPRHEEYPIHAEIMRARPEVLSVVHTHPKHSIALCARGLELRPVSHEGALFWPPGVPVVERSDLIRTRAEGEQVARALGEARALFLRNHGIAVPGVTIEEACFAAIFLERACEIQLLAQPSRDAPVHHTPEAEAIAKQAIWTGERVRAVFDYFARKLVGS